MSEIVEELDELTGGEEQNLGISSDLIRGHINTIILRSLYDGDKYGYDIINEIEKKSGGLYSLKQPTLYSALKRLESLKYVTSYYGDYSNGGRRKYFSLTDLGRKITEQNLSEWEYSRTIIDSLISDGNAHYDFSFITDKQKELVELKRALAAREQALEDEKTALNSLRNELQRERALLSAQSSSINEQKSDFNELKDKIDAQSAELEEKQLALSENQGEIDAKELAISEKEREIGDAKATLALQNAEIKELKALLEAQQAAFADTTRALDETKNELAGIKSDFALLQETNAELERQVETAHLSANSASEEELQAAKDQALALQAELLDKQSIINALNAAVASQEGTITALKSEQDNRASEYYSKTIELRAQQAQLDAQKEKLDADKLATEEQLAQMQALKAEIDEKSAELSTREETLARLEAEFKQNEENIRSFEQENSSTLAELEQEREELKTQLQVLEVERNTLRNDNAALEESKAKLERERTELNDLKEHLQAERAEIDRLTYEMTQREFALEESKALLDDKQTETNASSEEMERFREELQAKETELLRNTHKLQEDLNVLATQQKELASRQSAYNQQQLDFIARKNALAAQQFDFADKLAAYNAQVKLFNENLEKLEHERTALHLEQQQHDERVRALEKEKADLAEKRTAFEQEKAQAEQAQKDARDRVSADTTSLQRQINDLRERELDLNRRENDLRNAEREFSNRQYSAPYGSQSEYPYGYSAGQNTQYNYYSPTAPTQQPVNYGELQQRAQTEGIKLNTAGSYGVRQDAPRTNAQPQTSGGLYNVGLTLYRAAIILFCIVAFESLVVFFIKDYIGVDALYPAIGFALGFATFITCAILNACGYKSHARRKKHPSYVITAAVVFVICVIIVSMVAVYCKAQMNDPAQLFAFVIIPVIYLANILIFTAFYRLFSVKASK